MVKKLVNLGFGEAESKAALQAAGGNANIAAASLFNGDAGKGVLLSDGHEHVGESSTEDVPGNTAEDQGWVWEGLQ